MIKLLAQVICVLMTSGSGGREFVSLLIAAIRLAIRNL